ncbi:hypothetical protein JVU11DRAFT_4013 [Chiua virens]|nr:hypothetical protein JVU11DRAFT_4013 [Chiua virens]
MRNGYRIVVPGTILMGTLLYHGTYRDEIPPDPDWLSVDPENSYYFCRSHTVKLKPNQIKKDEVGILVCSQLFGPLKSYILMAPVLPSFRSGEIPEEVAPLQELCKWGRKLGVDGLMEMDL